MGSKRTIDIEKLLQWAYREELPKQAVSGLTGWEKLIYLGTMVDESEREHSLPAVLGPPHPDALLVERAVRNLEDRRISAAAWRSLRPDVMGDLAPYAPEDHPALVAMTFQTEALVTMHARMGTRPRWSLGAVRLVRIQEKNGKPRVQFLDDDGTLVTGLTAGRRYGRAARCPLQLEPPGPEIAAARMEYLVWRHALDEVRATVESWGLRDHAVAPALAAALPWWRDDEPRSRVLPSIQETVYHVDKPRRRRLARDLAS